jgi:hypothetical protein
MKKIILILSVLILFVSCSSKEHNKNASAKMTDSTVLDLKQKLNWNLANIEGKVLVFDNGEKIETSLFDLKYIGQLKTRSKIPYFILSGRSCNNCDENFSIYIWSPSDGSMKSNGKQPHYSYPGSENDYATNKLVYQNRMFFGACLGKENCIWVQKSLNDRGEWENSIFIVEVENDVLKEATLNESADMNAILDRVTGCTELPGIVSSTEP